MKKATLLTPLLLTPLLCACDVSLSPRPTETVSLAVENVAPVPVVPSLFSTGSLTRISPVAGSKLVVKYWLTSVTAATWTYSKSVPVSLAAHLEGKLKSEVKVSGFKATLSCGDQSLVLKEDSTPDIALTQPFEYGSAVTVQCPNPVDSATLSVEFDLAVKTDPSNDTFYKATVLDSFPITFAKDSDS